MLRYLTILSVVSVLVAGACSGAGARLIKDGNEEFAREDYEGAIGAYQQAQVETPGLAEPYYNAGNAYYRQDAYDPAQSQIALALENADGELRSDSFFNLGNAFFQREHFIDAVEAYKETLRLTPDDRDAKHNLELALNQLQEPEEGTEQEQEPGQQEGEGQESPQQPGPEEQEGAQQQQQSGQQQQQTGQSEQQPDSQQEPGTLTEEQARQLLDAIAQNIETLQEHLQQVFVAPGPAPEQDY